MYVHVVVLLIGAPATHVHTKKFVDLNSTAMSASPALPPTTPPHSPARPPPVSISSSASDEQWSMGPANPLSQDSSLREKHHRHQRTASSGGSVGPMSPVAASSSSAVTAASPSIPTTPLSPTSQRKLKYSVADFEFGDPLGEGSFGVVRAFSIYLYIYLSPLSLFKPFCGVCVC